MIIDGTVLCIHTVHLALVVQLGVMIDSTVQYSLIVQLAVITGGAVLVVEFNVFPGCTVWCGCVLSVQYDKGWFPLFQHNAPLVFLPVHKSHIDYLLITFILFCHNIKAPHIAAGNNLNIPIFR